MTHTPHPGPADSRARRVLLGAFGAAAVLGAFLTLAGLLAAPVAPAAAARPDALSGLRVSASSGGLLSNSSVPAMSFPWSSGLSPAV